MAELKVKMTPSRRIFDPNYEYSTRLTILDLDEECIKDITTGNGFFIEEPQSIKKDIKSDKSIFSSRFGSLPGETDAIIDKYSCECGAKKSRINHGTMCDICHTMVKYVDDNFEYFGWCCLKKPYYIIHPNLFKALETFIGSEAFNNIIEGKEEKDEDGFIRTEVEKPKDEPFYQIGMVEFHDRFDEVMEYYKKKRPSKLEYYEHIMENKSKVFTHSIPVYTIHLRPIRVEGENLIFENTNAIYNMICKLVGSINRDNLHIFRKQKLKKRLLYQLQSKVMELYKEIEDILSSKKGIVRNLFGGRYNFTSRSVIIPNPMLRTDQIILSYHALVKVLQQTIINIIKKSYNMNYSDAYDMWYKARLTVDPKVVEIINNLIKASPEGIPFIINRNPSINYGSILLMHCVGMSFSYTMSVPLQILAPLAGD